jgi:TolB-like protein
MLYRFGEYELDTDRHEFRVGGQVRDLGPQVFYLIRHLVENHDRLVSRDELIAVVWKGRIVSESTIDARIHAARKAVGDDGRRQTHIKTVPRRGYRFTADVEFAHSGEPSAAGNDVAGGNPLSPTGRPSIAVLPFANMSGDHEQEYFSDGITEDVITKLSRFEDLFVIARNSSFTYKNQRADVKAVAQELGVRYILEGSVRKAGQRVRITAQLINGQDGSHIWAEQYDGILEDIFDLQEQVTSQVVGSIAPHITLAEMERFGRGKRVFDEDHELAWRAQETRRKALRHRDPSMLDRAVAMAIEAVEMNAKCGIAYQVICNGYFLKSLYRWGDDLSESNRRAEDWAKKYLSELPNSYMAYHYLGIARFRKGQYQDANRDFQHAHELNPNDSAILWFWASCEARAGAIESAKEHAHMAIRLSSMRDNRIGNAYGALATAAFIEKDDAGFDEWAGKAIQSMPYHPVCRALMIAYAAESGNQSLVDTHRDELMRNTPDFIHSLFRGENQLLQQPEHMEMLLNGLRKAGLSE